MKLETYLKKHLSGLERYKREEFVIQFSKSGEMIDRRLLFHNDRLLTDVIYFAYAPPVYLRSVEKCKTLEDVLKFLYTFSYLPKWVKILRHYDTTNKKLKEILDFKLDLTKVDGWVYFGEYKIHIQNNTITFIMFPSYDCGTYNIIGKFDLLRIVNKILNLHSNLEFLIAVKKLEKI
jgi:hypothetical protein